MGVPQQVRNCQTKSRLCHFWIMLLATCLGFALAVPISTVKADSKAADPIDRDSTPTNLRVDRYDKFLRDYSLEGLKKITASQRIRVHEPHEKRERTYVGFPLKPLLTEMDNQWKQADQIVFTCADGYQAAVPVAHIQKFDAYLTYAVEGESEFKVQNKLQNEKDVPLGPFYLVWDNLKSTELKSQGATHWPYQVVGINIVFLKTRYPNSAPPPESSAAAKAGFAYFTVHCMTCHKMNGDGGDKAPELNHPASVVEYWKEPWLKKFLWDPRSVRASSTMPGMKDTGGTEKDLQNVMAYLKRMQSVKPKSPAATK